MAGAHRPIRTLVEDEGPFEGDLVTRAGGLAVRVDAERLHGWAGWAFAGAEHVAAPLDVALRVDGQDVLLPWCVRTVRTALAQAGDAGGISHGEAVTLAVSVLRGVLELEDGRPEGGGGRRGEGDHPQAHDDAAGDERHGGWWLTDEARPVFVIDASEGRHADGPPRVTGMDLLRELEGRIEDRALRRVLGRLAEALRDPRRLRAEAARWEAELLDVAAPRPLRLIVDEFATAAAEEGPAGPVSPRHERSSRRRELRSAGRVDAGLRRSGAIGGRRSRRAALPLRVLRGAVARGRGCVRALDVLRPGAREQVHRASSEPPVRSERAEQSGRSVRRRRRRGPVVVAASAAIAITVAGALWPSATGGADAAGRTSRAVESVSSRSGSPSPAEPTSSAPAGGGAAGGAPDRPRAPGASSLADPQAAGGELIAAARSCEATPKPACAEVWDGGAAASRSVRSAQEPVALIEDYGDVAALRNGSGEEAQMVVIIRRNAEWRIRDVYDIANPPSEGAGPP